MHWEIRPLLGLSDQAFAAWPVRSPCFACQIRPLRGLSDPGLQGMKSPNQHSKKRCLVALALGLGSSFILQLGRNRALVLPAMEKGQPCHHGTQELLATSDSYECALSHLQTVVTPSPSPAYTSGRLSQLMISHNHSHHKISHHIHLLDHHLKLRSSSSKSWKLQDGWQDWYSWGDDHGGGSGEGNWPTDVSPNERWWCDRERAKRLRMSREELIKEMQGHDVGLLSRHLNQMLKKHGMPVEPSPPSASSASSKGRGLYRHWVSPKLLRDNPDETPTKQTWERIKVPCGIDYPNLYCTWVCPN